ncbi:MAG: hypothetical protein IJA53_05745 [Spirochaetaceae bacterium]|nr:hypothetical protein [Spirochaetaceae bacterium]
MTDAVLCVDIGTSSLKAAYISFKGEVIAFARISIEKANESNRWLFALKQGISELNATICGNIHKEKSQNQNFLPKIKAISISGNGPSLANSKGSFLWNESLENLDLCKLPKETAGSIFAPRIFYVREKLNTLLTSSEGLFSVPEFLVYQLTDRAYTLLPNERFKKAYWSEELLKSMNIPFDVFPPFLELGNASGTLTEKGKKSLGVTGEQVEGCVPVFCGGPDFAIALIGTNTLSEGKICDRAGTSEGLNLCTNKPLISPEVRTLPSPINPLWNASVIIPDTGSRFATWKQSSIYKDVSYEECVNDLLQNKKSFGYELMINIALEVKNAYKILKSESEKNNIKLNEKICCTGGQAKNQSWLKLKSEIVEVPFYVQKCADSELVGNAAVALFGLGLYPSIAKAAEDLTKS